MQIFIHLCHNIWFLLLVLKNYNILLFCFICTQLNFQMLQTSSRTDAAPDARLFINLVKFFKRGVILILSKTQFRYYCNVLSLQLFNLIFGILCQITPSPSSFTYNSVHMFEPFQNQKNFPDWLNWTYMFAKQFFF